MRKTVIVSITTPCNSMKTIKSGISHNDILFVIDLITGLQQSTTITELVVLFSSNTGRDVMK